jgi:glycosyltransferase involved in cell wall biosynthesis
MKTSEKPLITTIIPTCNRPYLIANALESVLSQTFKDFQVCIYDNSSGDETEKIVRSFIEKEKRVKYHRHKENIGAVANFAFGLDLVDTPYFSFLSDDDSLLPTFYETALSAFTRYPKAGFFCGTVILSNMEGQVINVTTSSWKNIEFYEPPEGLFEMIPKHLDWMGILFKKEVKDQIGGIDTRIKAIDVDFLFRAAARFPYIVSKQPCALFFQHAKSYSYYAGLKVIWPGYLYIEENLMKSGFIQSSEIPRLKDVLRKDMQKKLLFMLVHSLKRKDFIDCLLTISVLRNHFNRPCFALFCRLSVKAFQFFDFLYPFLHLSLKIRKRIMKRNRGMQDLYGSYMNSNRKNG